MARGSKTGSGDLRGALETSFDATFATRLALKEKQIQQSYRPIIGVHKWFARRPGTMFRSLMLSEFAADQPLSESFWKGHDLRGVIADPFMGGGTPVYEATRLGFHVVATDINPMAYWVVRQSLQPLDLEAFREEARSVVADVEKQVGDLYRTWCDGCGEDADVKYHLWVKTADCPECGTENDLFPGHLVAEDERHPRNVLVCGECGELNEFAEVPTAARPQRCGGCKAKISVEGPAKNREIACRGCEKRFAYSGKGSDRSRPPEHRLFALEYHCAACKPGHDGRFFKKAGARDHRNFEEARRRLKSKRGLPIPEDEIPRGDETDRLLKWGYRRYREMFNERQLLGLGLLLKRIKRVANVECRHALLTVFSDFLRYQNLLCRYDTYALKCQDIFSVHGFPVGLVQCENNLLGIERVGSGSFRHFVEKYLRAKEYCRHPFETRQVGAKKEVVRIEGETLASRLTDGFPRGRSRQARLLAKPAWEMPLAKRSLDGVFTDPPYFDNVQYAELMDFCFVWLRLALRDEVPEFAAASTRAEHELTGNETMGRGLEHFTAGLSRVFSHYAAALKPGAPFVFTYHHNSPVAYLPLVVAILDAGLDCGATLPAAAEMGASLHIAGTGSSVLDSVFVCRERATRRGTPRGQPELALGAIAGLGAALAADVAAMRAADVKLTRGDILCLTAGHVARLAINALASSWDRDASLSERMERARRLLEQLTQQADASARASSLLLDLPARPPRRGAAVEATV